VVWFFMSFRLPIASIIVLRPLPGTPQQGILDNWSKSHQSDAG